ncbi:glutamate--cysteine ligase [Neiella marina]|uniref:Glutamate--cysteine ligase n=1 Tax=Neiella holothuriorum TaxID=2870530 RepID=A0ABS7EKC9_9GAMM|nr:glutamate--cysteine ligase [Neiella holothuriorum]MBW8192798.1 glutamate--cysteine ligase [Neiella holothuriorum]
MTDLITQRLTQLAETDIGETLQPIRRGIEKESLRIDSQGTLAQTPHPKAFGSALTHPAITTDFSESLVEFITPVTSSIDASLASLADAHKFAYSNMGDEQFWPLSMPCYVDDETNIPVAQYGSSNTAQMKTIYRKGLHLRYGSMMQVISGVHYNFSMPDAFWPIWQNILGDTSDVQSFRSTQYMGLLRNYYRYAWVLPFLFGASPALCSSFLQGKEQDLPFEKLGKGTLFLPYATSLRMSDLGYTNSAQSDLYVCHNSLEDYVKCLQKAISTPSDAFAQFGLKDADGNYRQLNTNVLQIENELYSPIRPKRVALPGETPTQALRRGGIEYIEVRSLDVNPFSPVGVDKLTIAFIDLLLCLCLIEESGPRDEADQQRARDNMIKVVHEGRRPGLMLERSAGPVSLREWGEDIVERLQPIAKLLDQGQRQRTYQQALSAQLRRFQQPELTTSGRLMEQLVKGNLDNGQFGLHLATQYKKLLTDVPYQNQSDSYWQQLASDSIQQQADLEAASAPSLDEFLSDYFARNQQPFSL